MIRETSAGIVIFRRGNEGGDQSKFLLLHYPSGHWDFVKGKMEPAESTRQTAVRETEEETGITDVVFVDGFEEWIEYHFEFRGKPVHKRVAFFLGETETEEIRISHEHLGFAWMGYDAAMKRITFDTARSVLEKAQRLLVKTL